MNLCLFGCNDQISRRPRISTGYRIINMMTEPCRLVRRCEVTAILILYGLPRYYISYALYPKMFTCLISFDICVATKKSLLKYRLLTGTILAHEMMHAWLKLKGTYLFSDKYCVDNCFYSSPLKCD